MMMIIIEVTIITVIPILQLLILSTERATGIVAARVCFENGISDTARSVSRSPPCCLEAHHMVDDTRPALP